MLKYTIHHQPFYPYECAGLIKAVINQNFMEKTIAKMTEDHGPHIGSQATSLAKVSFQLEAHVKKHLNFALPGFEGTGPALATFLFKKTESQFYLSDACTGYHALVKEGFTNTADNIATAILSTIDENYHEKNMGATAPPTTATPADFFDKVNALPITDEEKFAALKLYHHFDMYTQYMGQLIQHTIGLIDQVLPTYQHEIKAHMDGLDKNLATQGAQFFKDTFNLALDKGEYHFYPGVFDAFSMSLWGTGFSHLMSSVGLGIFDFITLMENTKTTLEKSEAFLKAISDTTKLSILKRLKDGPMYGTQLAEALNFTTANISHHASTLLSLELIYINKEHNRVYYHLNRPAITQHFEDAKGLFL